MAGVKKWGVFLLVLVLLGGGAALLFWDLGSECLSVLRDGRAQAGYLMAASNAEGGIYALGREQGQYVLVLGDQTGKRTDYWKLTAEGLPQDSVPTVLYPAAGGAVYLGLYDTEESQTYLQLYRITERGKTAELLLNEPCTGENLREQMASIRLSDFAEVDNVVTFALIQGENVTFYQRLSAESGLEALEQVTQPGVQGALALTDGTLVMATEDGLIRTDRTTIPLTNGEIVIKLIQAGTGVYYIDGAGLKVFYADFADWKPYAYLELEKDAYDLDNCTDLWVTRDGNALLLMGGDTLLLDRGSGVSDLSGMLCRPAGQCVLILAGLVLGVLVLTVVLWYVVCEQRQFRIPLLVRWGALTIAVACLGTAILIRGTVRPASQAAMAREAASLMGAVAAQTLQRYNLTDSELPVSLGDSLAAAEGDFYRDAAVSVYQMGENQTWTLTGSNQGQRSGVRAEMSASFDGTQVAKAMETGSLFWSRREGGETHYLLYRTDGNTLLAVDVNGSALVAEGQLSSQWMERGLIALSVLLSALALAILSLITIGLRRSLLGMERLAAGEREVLVAQGGGDELASLADDVNALSGALQEMERQQSELAQSYRRFVPERVLSLLGKTTIHEVDKQTFVSRHLATMMLWFRFPPQVYEKSGRELFDNLNEVIERTASIVTQNGGTVFNFAYDGYDAVFEGGSAAAVSTAVAVQQEILDMNQEREAAGKPPVTVRIALDEGNVMLGVVGDETQIEPTSISSSFAIVKHLVELCGRLGANILCTEAVMEGARGYGCRYMGKCLESGEAIRTYEIFEGDPYEIRKVKEATGERFSQGVYALYGRDFSQAKQIFLSLVHHNTGDGGARYYLYLADQLEKKPDETISLDSGM
ncbi:MAG TPA: hypothetical protein H9841_08520 [Candidatus Flavonifractor merdigallinarum]|uniref:HAMP domain-containing protein n=1 Tax=Candidatus Flavonifractor merdigallinarum TaxID=2838589 RepID=A0A9D1YA90_9FIRM|nr:hypothetical protein [Candidatus Flavonifractor merdigallinarum]